MGEKKTKRKAVEAEEKPLKKRALLKGLTPKVAEEKPAEDVSEAENSEAEEPKIEVPELAPWQTEVFIDGVPYDWSVEDVKGLAESYGKVVDCRAPKWQDSGRLRGFAHVQYSTVEEQQAAIKKLHGYYVSERRFLKVWESQAPKTHKTHNEEPPEDCKTIFVKNLPYDASEAEIAKVFESAGKVELVRVVTSMGRSKGFCYVDFRKSKSVKNALELCAAGKTVLKGRHLRVDFDTNKPRAGFHYRTDAYEQGYASGKKEKTATAA